MKIEFALQRYTKTFRKYYDIYRNKKDSQFPESLLFTSSGDWTRTSDLRVMSPTSYLLLYPAIWTANIQPFLFLTIT